MISDVRNNKMIQILVADDSMVDRCLVRELLLGQKNWTIIEAVDGEQALQLYVQQGADLVLTDLQMPKLDGLELVAAIKERSASTPVVLMTAQGSEEIAVQALQAGANSYIPKSMLTRELVEIVQRMLSLFREDRAYQRLVSYMTLNDCRFALDNDPELITSLVSFFRQGVTWMRICDECEQFRVAIALEEALLNAFYHGNLEVSSKLREVDNRRFTMLAEQRRHEPPYMHRQIHVHVHLSPAEARFVIRDEGPGFDPSKLPDPTDPENLAKPCGRGVLLMRSFMDEVFFNERGNEVTMIKRKNSSVEADAEEDELP